MFKKLHQITLSAAIFAAVCVPASSSSNAFPILPLSNNIEMQNNEVIPVQHRHQGMGQGMGWQFQRDGNRCRSRFGKCRHFYQGYYYQTPWWTLPLIFGGQIAMHNGGNAHVRWRFAHYRSYNSRTNSWLGNSGRRYQCNSPY